MKFLNKYKNELQYLDSIRGLPIAIYGAGRTAIPIYEYLKKDGHNVICFIDGDKSKHGQKLLNIPIVSKSNVINEIKYIITAPRGIGIKALGLNNIVDIPIMTFDKYYLIRNLKNLKEIYIHEMKDKASKKTLKNIILAILKTNDKYYAKINVPEQYFCVKNFMQFENEYLVDVGAFTGDSIERFIWLNPNFKKIVAFEPSESNLKALKIRKKRLNKEWALKKDQIEICSSAVGEKTGKINIDSLNTRANFYVNNFGEGEKEKVLQIESIDDYFSSNDNVGFIKADIEGHEISMLNGAQKIIKKQLPKLAICTYHNISDLCDIINLLNNITKNRYSYALRHHSNSFSETVLYCWAKLKNKGNE
jgi:FkbM family methyltransferase